MNVWTCYGRLTPCLDAPRLAGGGRGASAVQQRGDGAKLSASCAYAKTKPPKATSAPTYRHSVSEQSATKPAWRRAASQLSPQPFYVCPHRRYAYLPPAWAREAAAARTTAPFTTAWFCWRPQGATGLQFSSRVDVFRSVASVASQYHDVTDSLKKRPNPKARRRQKAARLAKAKAYS